MKKSCLKIKLFVLFLFVLSSSCITEASIFRDEYKTNLTVLEKQIEALDVKSSDYLDDFLSVKQRMFELQIENKRFSDAIKNSEEMIVYAKKNFGEFSDELRDLYLQRFHMFMTIQNPMDAIIALDDFKNIVFRSNNENLKREYYYLLSSYYALTQSPFKSIDALNNITDYYKISDEEKLNLLNQYILHSHASYNVIETKKYFDNYYKLNVKLYGENNSSLIAYYQSLLNFKLIVETDFVDFMQIYEKLDELTQKHDYNIHTTITNVGILVDYYIRTLQFEKAMNEIDLLSNEVNNYNCDDVKNRFFELKLKYYYSVADFRNIKKYANKIKKLSYKQYGSYSLRKLYALESLVDSNKNKNKYDKAEEISYETLDFLKIYENEAPVLKGKFLKNMSLLKRDMGEFEKALGYLYASEEAYKKELPAISYPLYETALEFAILYRLNGKYDEAMRYYNKAKDICYKMFGKYHRDSLNVHLGIAETNYHYGYKNEAIKHIDVAITIAEKIYGKDGIKVLNLIKIKDSFK